MLGENFLVILALFSVVFFFFFFFFLLHHKEPLTKIFIQPISSTRAWFCLFINNNRLFCRVHQLIEVNARSSISADHLFSLWNQQILHSCLICVFGIHEEESQQKCLEKILGESKWRSISIHEKFYRVRLALGKKIRWWRSRWREKQQIQFYENRHHSKLVTIELISCFANWIRDLILDRIDSRHLIESNLKPFASFTVFRRNKTKLSLLLSFIDLRLSHKKKK